jgi:hypothetical protein
LLAERARSHRLNTAAFVVGDTALLPQEREKVGQQRLVGQLDSTTDPNQAAQGDR